MAVVALDRDLRRLLEPRRRVDLVVGDRQRDELLGLAGAVEEVAVALNQAEVVLLARDQTQRLQRPPDKDLSRWFLGCSQRFSLFRISPVDFSVFGDLRCLNVSAWRALRSKATVESLARNCLR
jgi:hypothetical protein